MLEKCGEILKGFYDYIRIEGGDIKTKNMKVISIDFKGCCENIRIIY